MLLDTIYLGNQIPSCTIVSRTWTNAPGPCQ